ncbi:acyl-CoA dehydrogenase family protein [Tepidiphilus olei]|uniref:acyl-CoA dehydrogenase family protein n=1 Tax=Tepidiphilus olei TaxID=2502184 RepID=UPI00115EA016|nr:acyl-CoA dehydrogenase family protein [Tepidiphilus olei]
MRQLPSPWMNEELELLRESARRFIATEITPHEDEWNERQYVDRDLWRKAGAAGLLCTDVAEEYGGGGATFAHEAVILEEQAYAGNTSWAKGVHEIVAHYIEAYGTEEQKRRWLPPMAAGEMVGAIAMTEPGTGSDLQAVRTRAERRGDDYVINGSKTFISNGYHCDLLIIVCKTDTTVPGAKGVSLIVAETRDLPGFKRGRLLKKLGQKGQDTAELFFEDMRVPVANLLGGEEGKGFYQLMNQLPRERLIIAVGAIAVIEAALHHTLNYVRERKAFGHRILDFQNTRFKLAERQTEAYIGRLFVDHCVQRMLEGTLDAPTASMAKWWTTQKQCEIIDECLQFFGGYGYMLEYPIARMYADARVQKIYGGTNEIMKELIARTFG